MMASKKKVSKKETRPTKKPEVKIPDSEARVKRDVSDLEISPYWTVEEFYCFLVGRLNFGWDALYSDGEWSDADIIKFRDQFSVAHNLGLDLLKAAEKGEIECAGTPPKPFPHSFENKFDGESSGRLWNPAALDLKLTRESCLRYYARKKSAIKFRLNEVGHGIPKINECLLDNWADALPKETGSRTAKIRKAGPDTPTARRAAFKSKFFSIANKIKKTGKRPTLEAVQSHTEFPSYQEANFEGYPAKRTMENWLVEINK